MTTPGAQGAALIWCPFPDRGTARAVIGQLLDDGLIACANILGEIESLFVWKGRPDSSRETAVLFKTTAARLSETVARLGKLHPYDTPAIIGWCCDAAHPATLTWLGTACSGPAAGGRSQEQGC